MENTVKNSLITVIVPCYNEEESLTSLVCEIRKAVQNLPVQTEIVFVDDGSKDGTLELLRAYASDDPLIRYLSFSRNFGKEAAIYAGLQHAKGDYVVVMDADLQHPPSLLPQMYAALQSGEFDCAAARRITRNGEPPIRSFFSKLFYKIINKISDINIQPGATDFRLMTRQMVNAVLSMPERTRFSKGIFSWVGFRTHWLEYENTERVAGSSKWSFWKLFQYSILGFLAFSTLPLSIASFFGILMCLISFLMVLVIIIKTLLFGDPVSGWPSLACMIMFIGGLQLFCIGILGQYLAKVYVEIKGRPIYILAESSDGNV